MRLETARLRIRDLDPEADAAALLPLYADSEAMRFIGGRTLQDVDAVRDFLERRLSRSAPAPLGFWVVEERAGGRVVGTALLDRVPRTAADAAEPELGSDVQIGGALRRDCWRLGYATELGQALVRFAFLDVGLVDLVALAEPEHPVSHGLAGGLGFVDEGVTYAYYGGLTMRRHRLRVPGGDPAR